MVKTTPTNIRINKDNLEDIIVTVDWLCPACNRTYTAVIYTDINGLNNNDFSITKECKKCGEIVKIQFSLNN